MHDGDGVSDATMGAFARETRLSETTFVQTPTQEGASYRNRIWTVGGEIPFAGHPSLGTAVAVAGARGEAQATYVQETGAGLQPIDVGRDGDVWTASMRQGPVTFGAEADARHVMAATGLTPADAHRELAPQVVSTGLPALIAPLAGEGAVASAAPDFLLLRPLLDRYEANTLYLAWYDGDGGARARMFSPVVLGGEDPATGSAAGPLCAYLHAHGITPKIEITQGVEMGRPSRLLAEIDGDGVRVAGDVIVVIRGEVVL